MLKKLVGFGFLALLLTLPLQAHDPYRSRRHQGHSGYVEVHVGTRHGHGVFVRGFRPDSRHYYRDYYEPGYRGKRGFRKFKHKRGRYFKRHGHFHYNGRCPY